MEARFAYTLDAGPAVVVALDAIDRARLVLPPTGSVRVEVPDASPDWADQIEVQLQLANPASKWAPKELQKQ